MRLYPSLPEFTCYTIIKYLLKPVYRIKWNLDQMATNNTHSDSEYSVK